MNFTPIYKKHTDNSLLYAHRPYSPQSYSKVIRDKQGIEIDPEYEQSVILEHRVDTNRWPKQPEATRILGHLPLAMSPAKKAYVFIRGELIIYPSLSLSYKANPWAAACIKGNTHNTPARWIMKESEFESSEGRIFDYVAYEWIET